MCKYQEHLSTTYEIQTLKRHFTSPAWALYLAYAYDFGLSKPDYAYRCYSCKKTYTQLSNITKLTCLYNNNIIE